MPLEPKENTLKCKHLNAGLCSLGHFDMTPSTKDCLGCPDYDGTSRGWGDDFKKIMNDTSKAPTPGKILVPPQPNVSSPSLDVDLKTLGDNKTATWEYPTCEPQIIRQIC